MIAHNLFGVDYPSLQIFHVHLFNSLHSFPMSKCAIFTTPFDILTILNGVAILPLQVCLAKTYARLHSSFLPENMISDCFVSSQKSEILLCF